MMYIGYQLECILRWCAHWYSYRTCGGGVFKFYIYWMHHHYYTMMTSSNGNVFHITGHLCQEFTGHWWIPAQMPVTGSFDVFFDLHINKRLSKQWWGWWFEMPSRPLWRHCNVLCMNHWWQWNLECWIHLSNIKVTILSGAYFKLKICPTFHLENLKPMSLLHTLIMFLGDSYAM